MKVDLSKPVLVMSDAFADVVLRIDGQGITAASGSGAGKVSCDKGCNPENLFMVRKQDNGTVAFESVATPGVFLRMDGGNVRAFASSGAGVVNCQYGASDWERFKLVEQPNGSLAIESAAFPGVFLRVDSVQTGIVNCQFGVGKNERFHLVNAPDTGTMQELLRKFRK